MSDFVSLYTALSGLRAAQMGLSVTADNIANAGNAAHTRQRLDVSEAPSHMVHGFRLGAGVQIDGVSRARSQFLDLQAREASASYGRLGARADVLHRLESLFAGDGAGIADGLMDVWNTFEDLANSPDDIGMRTSVIGALDNLVTRINTAATGIDLVVSHTSFDLQTRVEETNRLLTELADLNSRVFDAEVTETPANDLLDRRDLVVDQLAALTGIRATEDERGMMRVSTGSVALVEGVNVVPLELDSDGVTITTPGGLEVTPGGALGGLRGALTVDIPDHRAELDAFVADLADTLNAAHAAGFTPAGAAGGPLLSYDAGAPARTLAGVVTDADDLAAAGAATAAPHDGDNAAAIGALRFSEVGAGGTLTLDDQFREFLTRLGSETSSALAAADSQESLSSSVNMQRLNQQGVSVDEEMMMLMNYQRSYEAAARVMNIIDETLELLVNRLGVGGR